MRLANERIAMDVVQTAPYDLLLPGGRGIDPARELDGVVDVAARGGGTAAVGRFQLQDNEYTKNVADQLIRPVLCRRAGKRFDADAVIQPKPQRAAA
jgi:predicted amidohydrolase